MAKLNTHEKTVLKKMFWRSGLLFSGFNVVKMQGNGFTNAMGPAFDDLFKNDLAGKGEALGRANGVFNTNNTTTGLIAGLTYALEKDRVEKQNVSTDTIESLKVSLMGPTAAVGDAFVFNCLRVIIAGITISIAKTGSLMGPLLFIILFGGSELLMRWYLLKAGYQYGTTFIDKVFNSGLLKIITNAASMIGLAMVGAMVATTVSVPLRFSVKFGKTTMKFSNIFNQIMPGLLSLILLFLMVYLLKKGVKPMRLVLGLLVVSIILAFFGIF
ncbi:PTS system mannose/fructose/sorbose family transporter subunit IID [Lacticaseibacillus paracasei]|uniref:PTS system mannose/fructose/sorbose family transporter subunit IID n=2 Tax=Lacticaseibacillus paracasei TaxID=1597 RepID=UPI0030CD74DB